MCRFVCFSLCMQIALCACLSVPPAYYVPSWYVVHAYVAVCVGCSMCMSLCALCIISEPIQILHVVKLLLELEISL